MAKRNCSKVETKEEQTRREEFISLVSQMSEKQKKLVLIQVRKLANLEASGMTLEEWKQSSLKEMEELMAA